MLDFYPFGQKNIGQHPRYPNHWRVSSIAQAENAIANAKNQNYDYFLLDTCNELYFDFTKDIEIKKQLLELLSLGFKIIVFTENHPFSPQEWKWDGYTLYNVEAIKITSQNCTLLT